MSLITFRDKNSKGDPVGPTWYLEFDAMTAEEFSRDAEITSYPVESGAVLSDHYQPQPRQINLLGAVSDTPSGPWTNLEGLQNAAAPPVMVQRPLELQIRPDQTRVGRVGIPRPITTTVLPSRRLIESNIERARLYIPRFALTLQTTGSSFSSSGVTRIASFQSILDGIMESRTTVDVILQSGLEYKNFMITSCRAPRVSGSGGMVRFALDLQEIVLANATETKSAEVREAPAIQSKKKKGRKGTKPVKPSTKEHSHFQTTVAPRILEFSRAL